MSKITFEVPEFSYSELAPEVAAEVKTHADQIQHYEKMSANAYIEFGRHLNEVRELIPDRSLFWKWCYSVTGRDHSSINRAMQVARFCDSHEIEGLDRLTQRSLALISQDNTPPEVVETVLKAVQSGHKMTEEKIKEVFNRHATEQFHKLAARNGNNVAAISPRHSDFKMPRILLDLRRTVFSTSKAFEKLIAYVDCQSRLELGDAMIELGKRLVSSTSEEQNHSSGINLGYGDEGDFDTADNSELQLTE